MQVSFHKRAFTLFEMMVVITIIAILASMMGVAMGSARERARQTDCMSNLRQLGVALVTYRAENYGRNPNWISNLYPYYIDDLEVYVCRSDKNRGRSEIYPKAIYGSVKYPETVDNVSVSRQHPNGNQNEDVEANSYMYEFSCATARSLGRSDITWAEYKENDLLVGNVGGTPYSSSRMPIVRCFHHALKRKVDAHPESNGRPVRNKITKAGMTINVAYAGNVTIAPLWWEGAVGAGE